MSGSNGAGLAELLRAERRYRTALGAAGRARFERDGAILAAYEAGMTKAAIARATGLGRARIGQILEARGAVEPA